MSYTHQGLVTIPFPHNSLHYGTDWDPIVLHKKTEAPKKGNSAKQITALRQAGVSVEVKQRGFFSCASS